ncbi:MAG TPA: PadR family transcriptional regulator [Nanoarchaeota archaeon]|nr:PadR family transcriptional regulator [Nanoarchaeota archaeon]
MEQPKHLKLKGFLAFRMLHELQKKRQCGDELAMAIGARFGTKLTPGTIYPALKFLRKKGLVSYKRFGRKKTYSLTEQGKDELKLLKKSFRRIFSGFL